MGKGSFLLREEHGPIVDQLTDEQAGQLIKAVFAYSSCDTPDTFTPPEDITVRVAFLFIKGSLDRANEHYEMICERNRVNGAKGGRPTNKTQSVNKNPVGCLGFSKNPDEPNKTLPDPDPDPKPDVQESTPDGVLVPSPAGDPRKVDTCPHQKIIALYHEVLPELPQVRIWNDSRIKLLRSRWREETKRQDLNWWRTFFGYIRRCPFLMGASKPRPDRPPFQADLEWIIRPQNFAKIVEGRYEAN